jgi:hypothetical protein
MPRRHWMSQLRSKHIVRNPARLAALGTLPVPGRDRALDTRSGPPGSYRMLGLGAPADTRPEALRS